MCRDLILLESGARILRGGHQAANLMGSRGDSIVKGNTKLGYISHTLSLVPNSSSYFILCNMLNDNMPHGNYFFHGKLLMEKRAMNYLNCGTRSLRNKKDTKIVLSITEVDYVRIY